MVTQTPDDPVSSNTQGIAQLGLRDSDNTLQFIKAQAPSEDLMGYSSLNTIFGEHITANRHTELVETFVYNINTYSLSTTVANSATVTQADSMAVLTSGTNAAGSARLNTKKFLRYRAGHEGYAFFTALWANGGVAGAVQYIGLFDSNNGYYIGYNGTDFVVGRRSNGSDTQVISSSFNGSSTFTDEFDNTKLNVFQINYGWLGAAPINFMWLNPEGKWVLIHRMQLPNTLTVPHTGSPALPMAMQVTKTSGATSIIMKSASWHAGISHDGDTIGDRFFTGSISATTISAETVLINFQNVSTFQSKINKVRVVAVQLNASSEGTKTGEIKIYKNLAIGGTPSWSNVDATNSVMQTDTAGTVTPSNTNLLVDIPLAKTDSVSLDVGKLEFYLLPSETATVTAQSASNMDFTFSARWREEF